MKRKCDKCDRSATHHSIRIEKGQKIEEHLCDQHALEAGFGPKTVHKPINELLTNFVKLHSGGEEEDPRCGQCGLSFSTFKEENLLGCPQCYEDLIRRLEPLLERAHEGASHHVGRVPRQLSAGEHRQRLLLRLRRQLEEAVETEHYELAAGLRDEIGRLERESEASDAASGSTPGSSAS